MTKLKICDSKHPYFEGSFEDGPQCSELISVYRCMGSQGHSQKYHVTYGYKDRSMIYYWWRPNLLRRIFKEKHNGK